MLVRKFDCWLGLKLFKGDVLVSNYDYICFCEYRLFFYSVMGENYIVDVFFNV